MLIRFVSVKPGANVMPPLLFRRNLRFSILPQARDNWVSRGCRLLYEADWYEPVIEVLTRSCRSAHTTGTYLGGLAVVVSIWPPNLNLRLSFSSVMTCESMYCRRPAYAEIFLIDLALPSR